MTYYIMLLHCRVWRVLCMSQQDVPFHFLQEWHHRWWRVGYNSVITLKKGSARNDNINQVFTIWELVMGRSYPKQCSSEFTKACSSLSLLPLPTSPISCRVEHYTHLPPCLRQIGLVERFEWAFAQYSHYENIERKRNTEHTIKVVHFQAKDKQMLGFTDTFIFYSVINVEAHELYWLHAMHMC